MSVSTLFLNRQLSLHSRRAGDVAPYLFRHKTSQLGVFSLLTFVCLLLILPPTPALIFIGSAAPEHNTTAPTGPLADSGWQFQGNWGDFNGTPIGPHHFITSWHLGGVVGHTFTFQGASYTTVSAAIDPGADLRIWEVRETFPTFAPLYDGPDETGEPLVVFGRGARRGPEVVVNGQVGGWYWGVWDRRQRWGTNIVTAVIREPGQPAADSPRLLQVDFNLESGGDEAHLAVGDSGGGVFIPHDGVWKLAGINYTVDGPYSSTPTGSEFNAAMYNHVGLFVGSEGNRQLITPLTPVGSFYSMRIKARLDWINSILARPTTPILLESSNPEGPYLAAASAAVNADAKTIQTPIAPNTRFFELQSSIARRITSVRREGSTLVIYYE